MKKIAVLTGAGISAESGIKTFRDADGLWEGHDVQEVASPEGFERNPSMVLDFYNQRRRQLLEVTPNAGHKALVELEKHYDVVVITQNVDDLHERAGSSHIIHLHGELLKNRSTTHPHLIYESTEDIVLGSTCEKGGQLRPHIVWFGEMVPMLEPAIQEVSQADVIMVVGTSMQVYPAASLVAYGPPGVQLYYVDPRPHMSYELQQSKNLTVIEKNATIGVPELVKELIAKKRGTDDNISASS